MFILMISVWTTLDKAASSVAGKARQTSLELRF